MPTQVSPEINRRMLKEREREGGGREREREREGGGGGQLSLYTGSAAVRADLLRQKISRYIVCLKGRERERERGGRGEE